MGTKYARIARPSHPTDIYHRDGVAFKKRAWTSFDDVAHPHIATDAILEVVTSVPALVDDTQATATELRDGLRDSLQNIDRLEAELEAAEEG